MTDGDHLGRLEARVETLERLVRQLLAERGPPGAGPAATPRAPESPAAPPITVRHPRRPRWRPPAGLDGEQWVGQRGLLAVGVTALVLALAYLLKLSFDRGWVSPAVRCSGGAFVGVLVGGLGWHLERKGFRSYGAALIGAGAGMIYLAVWAAGRLYGFLPPPSAIGALALVSLGLALLAYAIDVEALGATAAVGAFLAPVAIGPSSSNPDLLLVYLGAMGAAVGAVAALKRWRVAAILVLLAYFGLGSWAAREAYPWLALVFAVVGGAGGIGLGLRERWWETRLVAFGGGWSCLAAAAPGLGPHGLLLAGGAALSYPVWRHALTHPVVPFTGRDGVAPSWRESFYFYATPWFLGWAVDRIGITAFESHRGLAAECVAVAYLAAAFGTAGEPFALVAAGAAGVGALYEWGGLHAAWALGALALLWGAVGRGARRQDWERYGAVTLLAAVTQLGLIARDERALGAPAFVDGWAFTLWALTAMTLAWGAGLVGGPTDDPILRGIRRACWSLGGAMIFIGVTGELQRFFLLAELSRETRALAGGLAVSAWWILFAAGLILLGFRRSLKPVRVAGLWVSGMAVGKVLLVDLSALDALYRIGSVLLLGLGSLGAAYLYHRRARAAD
ncbi:MAG TPA: DUF2339 domain-containing protein [Gemmatimonadales bacterium]|nr:DUF2339 domain-containing protein [Gemmatimonadales bacterium]